MYIPGLGGHPPLHLIPNTDSQKRTVAEAFSFLAILTEWGLRIYQWVVILAILVTWVTPDPRNPVVQFLNGLTAPLFKWLAGVLPSALQMFNAYCALLLIWFLEIFLPGVLRSLAAYSDGAVTLSQLPTITTGFFLLGVGVVVRSMFYFFILLLLIWFFLTLISPSVNNPIVRTIYFLVDPLITPIQKRMPRQRFDMSPLLAAGFFLAINLVVLPPLLGFAIELAQGGVASLAPMRTF